ncbi:MAG TPA: hypothetical protein VNB22_00985 [Pyrinomonadaceae bacterium]|jgi:hypothetical protein|nr:hypothetical protein [Pyrinomonadaceae bacterium]
MKNQLNKQFYVIFSSLLMIAFLAAGFVPAEAHEGDGGGECETKECRQALTAAKKATAKYHDFQTAIDEGFVQLSPCVSVPGLGAMGFHYGNFGRIMNPNADATEPEVLLYLPDEDGTMRLVGLEYVVPAPLVPAPPVLFGQTYFYSPERNSYELHVWAWRNNPSGTFAPFNPKLECPSANN